MTVVFSGLHRREGAGMNLLVRVSASEAFLSSGERLPSDRERLAEMDLHVSEDLQALVKQMLQTDPSARPSAAAINRRIGELYAGHPDWSAPMERVASLSFGLHRSASGVGEQVYPMKRICICSAIAGSPGAGSRPSATTNNGTAPRPPAYWGG